MRTDRLAQVDKLIHTYQEKAAALRERAKGEPYALAGCLETGAVRRASLDLTRALADLRRPDHV